MGRRQAKSWRQEKSWFDYWPCKCTIYLVVAFPALPFSMQAALVFYHVIKFETRKDSVPKCHFDQTDCEKNKSGTS